MRFHMNEPSSSDACNVSNVPSGIPYLITNFAAHITRWALKFLLWRTVCILGLTEFPTEDHLITNFVNIVNAK